MGLARYMVLSGLRNRNMWFWGFGWMLMWIVFGAFIFNAEFTEIPQQFWEDAVRYYTAFWSAFIITNTSAATLVGLLNTLVHQAGGVVYLQKYGRLTPGRLVASYYAGMLIPSLIFSLVLIALTTALFYVGFRHHGIYVDLSAVLPKDPIWGTAAVVGLALLAFVFAQSLVFLMGVAALSVSPRHVLRISYLPLMLVFASYLAYVFLPMPSWAFFVNPFLTLIGTIGAAYGGLDRLPSNLAGQPNGIMTMGDAVSIIIVWTAALTALAIPMTLRIRYSHVEELREL